MALQQANIHFEAFKYRIYPSEEQKEQINKTIECCRILWNLELDYLLTNRTDDGKYPDLLSYTVFKKEVPVLSEADSCALSYTLMRLRKSLRVFYKELKNSKGKQIPYEQRYTKSARLKKAQNSNYELQLSDMKGHPQFKRKDWKGSYSTSNNHIPDLKDSIRIEEKQWIHLPKLGNVSIVYHRSIPESYVIKSATISHTGTDQYYVSVLCEYIKEIKKRDEKQIVLYHDSPVSLYVDQYGNRRTLNYDVKPNHDRIDSLNQLISKKETYSKNRKKLQIKINKLYENIELNITHELHKISSELANLYDVIILNQFDTKSLMTGKDNEHIPKKELAERNKMISAMSWSRFVYFLEYKLNRKGGELILLEKPEEINTSEDWFQFVDKQIMNTT